MGSRIIKMDPAQGFAAQGVGATVILAASHVGFPLSTTHVISGAIMGTGAAKRVSAVRWGVAGNIVVAWVLTLPAAAAVGGLTYAVVALLGSESAGPIVVVRGAAHRARDGAREAARGRPHADGGGLMLVFAVDAHLLWQVVWVSTLAGVGISALFSLVIVGRRARRGRAPRRPRRRGRGLRVSPSLCSRSSPPASCSACRP